MHGSAHGVAHRLGGPGDRRQDRPGDVGVARARAHPDRRIAQPGAAQRLSVGLRAHQLGRSRGRAQSRATCCCPRATRGRCTTSTSTAAGSAGAWAASTAASSSAPGTRFYWQHDAEWQPGGLISVFDNGSDPPKEKQSRGLLLDPNLATHTVTLVKQFVNPTKTLLAASQGNTLSLPGGNWLMGYGGLPNFTEYDSSGHVLLDGDARQERPELPHLPLALERAAARARRRSWRQPSGARRARRRGELERGHRSRLLAGAGGRLAERARAGRHAPPRTGFQTDDHGAARRPLRGGPGARRLGRGHRHLGDGQGLSAPPASRSGARLLAG